MHTPRLLAALLALAGTARAAPIAVQLTHSGYILTASDAPLEAPSQAFTFTLFDAATNGAQVWSGSCAVPVTQGYYAVRLGAPGCGPALDTSQLAPGSPRYLQVSLGGVALEPRLAITMAPAAALAQEALHAADADRLGGVAAAEYQLKTDTIDWSRLAGAPAFAPVATSGSYDDLADKPTPASLGAEPAIAAGTLAQYWRGDKGWAALNTGAVPEAGNLYFTNARAIGATLTGFSATSGAITASDSVLSAIAKLDGARANANLQSPVTLSATLGSSCPTPGRLATDAAGNLLVCDDAPSTLQGKDCSAFGAGAMTVDASGNFFLCLN